MKTIKILTEFKGYNCSEQYDVNFKYHTNDKGEKCFFVDNYSLIREYTVECFDTDSIISNFENDQTTILKVTQISDEPSVFDSLKKFNPKDPWYKIVSETNISKTILNREEKVCINEVDYDCHSFSELY